MERLLLPIEDAAKIISVSRSTMYQLIASGELEVVHIGRSARVPSDVLSAYVARLQEQQNQAVQ